MIFFIFNEKFSFFQRNFTISVSFLYRVAVHSCVDTFLLGHVHIFFAHTFLFIDHVVVLAPDLISLLLGLCCIQRYFDLKHLSFGNAKLKYTFEGLLAAAVILTM